MDVQDAAPLAVPMIASVVGGLVWLLRLEGRVNLHESLHNRMAADLAYIRERIDHATHQKKDTP